MQQLKIRIDEYENKLIEQNAKSLNLSKQNYLLKCHIEFCKQNHLELNLRAERRLMELASTETHHQLFFIKNALQMLYREIEWQIRFKEGTYNIERAKFIIREQLAIFEKLPENVKNILADDKHLLEKLLETPKLDAFVSDMRCTKERNKMIQYSK